MGTQPLYMPITHLRLQTATNKLFLNVNVSLENDKTLKMVAGDPIAIGCTILVRYTVDIGSDSYYHEEVELPWNGRFANVETIVETGLETRYSSDSSDRAEPV